MLSLSAQCVDHKVCKNDLAWHGNTTAMVQHLKCEHVGLNNKVRLQKNTSTFLTW